MAKQPPPAAPPAQPQPGVEDPPSTQYIAEQFVRQYYLILQNSPWQLHHFYKDASMYTVQYQHGVQTVQGAQNIGNCIQETLPNAIGPQLEGKERSCEIKNIRWAHQVSLHGSLVVAVSGSQVSTKNGQSQRFSQTFVLASEPGQANAYYINNDMCSFEPEVPMMAAPPPMGVQMPNGAPPPMHVPGPQGLVPMSPPGAKPKPLPVPAPVQIPMEQQQAAESPPSPEKDSSSPKFGTMPEENVGPETLDIGKPTIPASAVPVAPVAPAPIEDPAPKAAQEAVVKATDEAADEAKEAPKEENKESPVPSGPMSWAAMAAAHKPEVKEVPVKPPPRKSSPAAAPTEGEDKEVPTSGDDKEAAPRKEKAPYKAQDAAELDASVFVSGVPHTCDEEKLKEIFGKHGEVVKVSLKAEKHFAIIDFNNTDSAAEALKTPALKCDSSIMKVEPRRRGGAPPSKSRGKGEGRSSGKGSRGQGRDGGGRGTGRRGSPRVAE